jgi:hypothetical protein
MLCISFIILSEGLGKTVRDWIKIGIAKDFIAVFFPM